MCNYLCMLLRNDDIIAPQLAKSDIIKRNYFNLLGRYSNLIFAIYTQTSL